MPIKILKKKLVSKNVRDMMRTGQVVLEFTFAMIIVMLMIYGAMKVFQWTGEDLARRRIAHDERLTNTQIIRDYDDFPDGPAANIDPYFYDPAGFNAIWKGRVNREP